ncbi:hypothetical protein HDV05_001527 [Chytridiales sp. JEL 0842]|nr:hypothetical protein HDV05_001527 [Chytridiales sp. JEL 0842]
MSYNNRGPYPNSAPYYNQQQPPPQQQQQQQPYYSNNMNDNYGPTDDYYNHQTYNNNNNNNGGYDSTTSSYYGGGGGNAPVPPTHNPNLQDVYNYDNYSQNNSQTDLFQGHGGYDSRHHQHGQPSPPYGQNSLNYASPIDDASVNNLYANAAPIAGYNGGGDVRNPDAAYRPQQQQQQPYYGASGVPQPWNQQQQNMKSASSEKLKEKSSLDSFDDTHILANAKGTTTHTREKPKAAGARACFSALYAYLCCCIPRNRKARTICLSITAVILVALGVVGFFYWPRFPEIKVVELKLNEIDGGAFQFDLPESAKGNLNQMTITLNLKMNVSLFNNNLYALKLETLDLKAYMICNKTEIKANRNPRSLNIEKLIGPAPVGRDPSYVPSFTPLIGTSKKGNLFFPPKSNTTFEMIFEFKFTPDPMVGLLDDPAFAELLNVCGVTASRRRPVRIDYYASSQVAILKSLGYVPVVEGFLNVECPATMEQINSLVNIGDGSGNLPPGKTAIDVLKEAFSGGSEEPPAPSTTRGRRAEL